MRNTLLRRYKGIILGIGMLMTMLLASACAGVPTNTTSTGGTTGTSGTPGATTTATSGTTSGSNQPTATQQTATFVPGNIQFTGRVTSVTASSIVVQMPDGGPLTMSITPQTKLPHNSGLPTSGQIVNIDTLASNGSFTATKIDQADQKDQAKQNSVQYRGVTRSAVGTDNILHLGVGDKTWNFTINTTTDLSKFNNNAQSIQANQSLKVDVLFNGTNGIVTKVDSDSGNN